MQKGDDPFILGPMGLFSGALRVFHQFCWINRVQRLQPLPSRKPEGFMRLTKTKTINVEYEGERKHCCILLLCLILRRNSRNFWEVACLTEVFEAGGQTIK